MKSQKRLLGYFFAVILILPGMMLAEPAAEAQTKAKPTETPSAHLTRREIYDKLQVTREQRGLLRQNRADFRKKTAELDGQIKVKKVDLENELEKPEPDLEKIDLITAEIGALLGKKYSVQTKAMLEVEKKILTPQQTDQLKALEGKEIFVIP